MVMGLQKVFEGEEDKILGLTPTADIRPNHRREATGCEQVVHRLVVFTTQATGINQFAWKLRACKYELQL
ncbi:hypothetical protein Hdeb2414_s0020g00557061 [Helianthus debilis subsp. tardiflorus]